MSSRSELAKALIRGKVTGRSGPYRRGGVNPTNRKPTAPTTARATTRSANAHKATLGTAYIKAFQLENFGDEREE